MEKHLIINKVNHSHINHKIRKTGKYAKYERVAKVYFNNIDSNTYNSKNEFMIYKLAMYCLNNNATTNLNKLSNLRKGFALLKKLSIKKHLVAKYRLAQLYFKGNDVVAQDIKKAVQLLETIIEYSTNEYVSFHAMYDLATIYLNGNGVQRNFNKAVDLLSEIQVNINLPTDGDYKHYKKEFPMHKFLKLSDPFIKDKIQCTNDEINYLFKQIVDICNLDVAENAFIDYRELVGYANRHNLILNLNYIFMEYKCNWGLAKQQLISYSNFQEFTSNIDRSCPITLTEILDDSEVIIFTGLEYNISGVFHYDALIEYWSQNQEKIGLNPYSESDDCYRLFNYNPHLSTFHF